jgi:hypothetical protein
MNDWQPIETAPKDGRTIYLAWSPGDWTLGEGFWRGDKWVACAKFYRPGFLNPFELREYYPEPTHWARLPVPPGEPDDARQPCSS